MYEMTPGIERYTMILSLSITNLREEDFGVYVCVGDSILGDDSESMTLYGK